MHKLVFVSILSLLLTKPWVDTVRLLCLCKMYTFDNWDLKGPNRSTVKSTVFYYLQLTYGFCYLQLYHFISNSLLIRSYYKVSTSNSMKNALHLYDNYFFLNDWAQRMAFLTSFRYILREDLNSWTSPDTELIQEETANSCCST